MTRLIDMGVEPYLVASSLEAVLAQRLVRVLCKHCKQPDSSPTTAAIKAQIGIPADTTVYRATGCRECRNTGYHGRHAIFEWMDIDNELRQLVLKNVSSGEIAAMAKKNGLRVLSGMAGGSCAWASPRRKKFARHQDQSVSNIAPEAAPKPTVEVKLRGNQMPLFDYKALQLLMEASRRPAGSGGPARRRFGRWKDWACGLSRSPSGRRRSPRKQFCGDSRKARWFGAQVCVAPKSPRATSKISPAYFESAAAGTAQSRVGCSPQGKPLRPPPEVKWKEIHDLVIDGMSLADAMAKSPRLSARLYRDGPWVRRVASSTWCWRRSPIFKRAKRPARQSAHRDALPGHPDGAGARVVVFLLVFFIPKFQTIFSGLAHRCRR